MLPMLVVLRSRIMVGMMASGSSAATMGRGATSRIDPAPTAPGRGRPLGVALRIDVMPSGR